MEEEGGWGVRGQFGSNYEIVIELRLKRQYLSVHFIRYLDEAVSKRMIGMTRISNN